MPALGPDTPLFIVLNQASGSGDPDEVEASIRQSLDRAGRRYRIHRIESPSQLDDVAKAAVDGASREHGAVVVVGGDGTINAVTQAVLPAGVLFGVLPQGTFNFFGRCHGLPEGAAGEGILALLDAHETPVQVAAVNDRAFLVNASLGLYPELLEQREGAKQRFGRHRLVALGAGLKTLMGHFRRLRLTLHGDAPVRELAAMTLVVGNNRLQLEKLGIAQAPAVDNGALAGIVVRPVGRWRLIGMAARGLLGHLGNQAHVESFAFTELTVAVGRRRKTKVALDGEIFQLALPLRFTVSPHALRLLVPRDAEPERA